MNKAKLKELTFTRAMFSFGNLVSGLRRLPQIENGHPKLSAREQKV